MRERKRVADSGRNARAIVENERLCSQTNNTSSKTQHLLDLPWSMDETVPEKNAMLTKKANIHIDVKLQERTVLP